MIKVWVKAKESVRVSTGIGDVDLNEDEDKEVEFINKAKLDAIVGLGVIEIVEALPDKHPEEELPTGVILEKFKGKGKSKQK